MDTFHKDGQKEDSNEENWRELELFGAFSNGSDKYAPNIINSSRFTLWNVIPKSLYEQFQKISNLWFVFIVIISFANQEDNLWHRLSRLIPLVFILSINVFKDIISCIHQKKSDEKLNFKEYSVWDGQMFKEKLASEILVGDILLILEYDSVPADMLLLYVWSQKECFVDTFSVLGERNLQVKRPVKDSQALLEGCDLEETSANLKRLNGNILVRNVCKSEEFSGKMKLRLFPKATMLGRENLIIRGTILNNTPWILGYVLYTGQESGFPVRKKKKEVSMTEQKLEYWNSWLILTMILLTLLNFLICTFLYPSQNTDPSSYYLFNFICQIQDLIPISLFLVIHMIHIARALIIRREGFGSIIKNPECLEDLGHTEYVVANKTGTITRNELSAQVCIIGDKVYWKNPQQNPDDNSEAKDLYKILNRHESDNYNFKDLRKDIEKGGKIIYNYLLCMALCNHTTTKGLGEEYFSLSVDDKVLVETAAMLGMKLLTRENSSCVLNFNGKDLEFIILGYQHFSSDLKKCRILVKDNKRGGGFLYVKGPKEEMLKIFKMSQEERTSIEEFTLSKHLIRMRTVIMGYKKLTVAELEEFDFSYQASLSSPVNSSGRVDGVFEIVEKDCDYLGIAAIEDTIDDETRDCLNFLSQSGVKTWITSCDSEESTLTAGVSSKLFEENVRIVRLTNFTSQTECLNIMSQQIKEHIHHEHIKKEQNSNSFIQESEQDEDSPNYRMKSEPLIFVGMQNSSYMQQEENKNIDKLTGANSPREIQTLITKQDSREIPKVGFNPDSVYFVLSVDKSGLEYGMASEETRKQFISLLFAAHCVCFHSLQAENKAKVVKLLRKNFRFKPVVLTIGDGQCDAGMLHEASIGAGIIKPHSHLTNVADVLIVHFYQIMHLIMYQGHWSAINLSTIVMYSLYSRVLWATVLVLFNILTRFNSEVLINDELIVLYSIVFPIIQMVFVGLYDKDLDERQIKMYPQVYSLGIYREIISTHKVFLNISEGLIHGFIISLLFYISDYIGITTNGYSIGLSDMSFSIALALFISCTCKLVIETHMISLMTILGHLISLALLIIHLFVRSSENGEWSGFGWMLFKMPSLMIGIFLIPAFVFVLQYAVKAAKSIFWPDVLQYIKSINSREVSFELISRLNSFKDELHRVYLKSNDWNGKKDKDSLEFSHTTLKFKSKQPEFEYTQGKIIENLKTYRNLLLLSCIMTGIIIICITTIEDQAYPNKSVIILPCLILLIISMVMYSYTFSFRQNFKHFITSYYLILLLFIIIASVLYEIPLSEANSVLLPVFFIAFNSDWFAFLLVAGISTLITCANSIRYYGNIEFSEELTLVFMIYFIGLFVNTASVGYNIDKTKRQEYILIRKVEIEVDKSKSVLSYLLPAFVRKRVKDGCRYLSEDQGTVSVFFCDIMDFEEIVASFTPIELTTFLDDVFGKFDQICQTVGVTKIETVGKTYMACAGLKDSEEEIDPYFATVTHARRAIELGLAIIRIVNSINLRKGVTLSVKIGVNSGGVTAGVIGFHKPQFSLVGDTVNTASRMGSTCPSPNTLQISDATYELLEDKRGLIFSQRSVEVKGKGLMKTWLVRLPTNLNENSQLEQPCAPFINNLSGNPSQAPARAMTLYHRNTIIDNNTTGHERRLSALMTHLEISDMKQLFQRKDTELIEQVQWFSFSCTEKVKEKRFRLETLENNRPVITLGMIVIIVCNICSIIIHAISFSQGRLVYHYYIGKVAIETAFEIALLIGIRWYLKDLWFAWSIELVYLGFSIIEILIGLVEPRDLRIQFISYLNHIFLFSHCAELFFKHNFWSLIVITVLWVICIEITLYEKAVLISIFSLIVLGTLSFTVYTSERNLRINSTLKAAANKELDKTERLIKQMMPPHVVQNLKEQSSITDKIPQVTVLYADIVGFTAWSSTRTPEEIVTMLSELFTMFDKNCVNHKVYKVHTIGDCYVAMGYTGEVARDTVKECLNIIEFAQQTLQIIQNVNNENEINLNMRIGIHTGDVTAGVTGTNIVRYDIYGSDVMIANKIESCGIPGRILVSEATKNIVEGCKGSEFVFTPHVNFYVNSTKKKINTFLLDSKEVSDI
ncbi:hypothetical protein SteCoe_10216 [Stentor coeruleus]|uniref:Guanylate cyclase domain-containing protein n=1 Tax=Stentor coeruleus TaxID=5963 RepID=A0A1R2CGB2_9CILI|nr:hypothetical protein SteCoe_10216 [Stentor coeruleus]